ncbi:MAG: type II secretion system F family protein [Pseudomonadota bacterium]|jgi:type II secretory pathway component PulF
MGIQIGKAGLSTADRVDFFRTLSEWLNSGGGQMSLAEAVRNTTAGFSQEEYATLAPQMEVVAQDVSSGQVALFEALSNSGLGFRPQEIAVMEAAEKSSQLRQTLPSLVAALETEQSGRRDLFTKLSGPSVIGVMLIGLTMGVLVFLLPLVITPVIERNPQALERFPVILLWLWYVSVWLRTNYIFIFIGLAVLVVLFLCRNTPILQPFWLRFLLRWNVTRKLILGFNSMVVVYYLPALLRSGMPSFQALEILAGCVTNPVIAGMLLAASDDHRGGLRLSQATADLPFKSSFFNALEAGEATGAIADRVQDLQSPYRYDLERYVRQVGSTIKFLVMAVLLPLFIVSAYGSFVGPIFALMEYK